MADLIPIRKGKIATETIQTVNARELHGFLEVQTAFKDWIVRRIEEYGFEDGKDFCSILSKTPKGGRPAKDYHLSLDMAKELSMVERTDKGREARRYFIECERRALERDALPEEPVMMPGKATLAGLRRVLAVWALLADLPPQALLDQTFAQFGLTEEDEDNPQDALDAALRHVLRQNNLLLAQGRKISREALHRYEQAMLGAAEPPVVKLFWRQFRKLNADGHLNHSRNPELIALRLGEVALAAQAQGLYPFSVTELRQQLPKGHTFRLMASTKTVNSVLLGKAMRCMVFFQAEKEAAQGDKEAGNA